jgi:PAS domain S-box-containing protein
MMLPPKTLSWTLRWLVLLAVTPALGIILYEGLAARRQALEDAGQLALQLALSTGKVQERITGGVRQLVEVLSETPEVKNVRRHETSVLLQRVLERNPGLTNLFIIDLYGDCIASALPFKDVNLRGRQYYHEAVRAKTFVVGEHQVDLIARVSLLPFATPLFDERGEVMAVFGAALALNDTYSGILETVELPGNSIIALADRNGIRLMRYPVVHGGPQVGEHVSPFAWEHLSGAQESGVFSHLALDGIRRIFGYKQLRLAPDQQPYMYILVGIPEDDAQAAANRRLYISLGLLGGATLLALATAHVVGRKAIKARIDRVVETTERLGRGDLSARCRLAGGPRELARLAGAVDAMAEALSWDDLERRQDAQTLQEARELLELRVEERTARLSQTVAALQESEWRHRLIFESSPLGMLLLDKNGVIAHCNDKFIELMGSSREKLLGFSTARIQHPELKKAIADALVGQVTVFEGAYTSVTGGRKLSIRACFNPVHSGQAPSEVIATVENVSEQRENEAELRRLWSIVERCPASIVITDAGARIQYVNPYFTVNTGYTREEALRLNPRILQSGMHDAQFYKDMWRVLRSGQTWRGEFCNKKKNGELYWEDATISPIVNEKGRITHYIGVKEDITERKNYEAELKQALSEFEALFNSSSVGIMHLKEGRSLYRVNHRFLEMFGYEESELLGRDTEALHLSHERFIEFGERHYDKIHQGGVVQVEQRLRRKDGRLLWCNMYGRAVNSEKTSDGVFWVIDDITPRIELEKLREDVERIMRHDLKAPLNGIINLPQLALSLGPLSSEQAECMREIENAGRRMLSQINLSLDLYKMETGAYNFLPEAVDLARVVTRVITELRWLCDQRGVRVETRLGDRPLGPLDQAVAAASELLCHTMLANLIKNAIEASPAQGCVTVSLRVGARISVSVHNVMPVPEQIRSVFFEKYATYGKEDGTGLGAYSAKLMAKAQGGDISMESSEQEGTRITVRLIRSDYYADLLLLGAENS